MVSALPKPASRADSGTERPGSTAGRAASMRIDSTYCAGVVTSAQRCLRCKRFHGAIGGGRVRGDGFGSRTQL
jgi:hypothetical protein